MTTMRKETKWFPIGHLHGYEERINTDGYREVRPIACKACGGEFEAPIHSSSPGSHRFLAQEPVHPTDDELRDTLTKYEGCVSRVERDGDDSDEAVNELAEAREALMEVLKAARDKISG
jgi:hypothetical protein